MHDKTRSAFLAAVLTMASIPAFAASSAPPPGAPAVTVSAFLLSLSPVAALATSSRSEAERSIIQQPFYGYCSQSCQPCYSGNKPACPLDDDGNGQFCAPA